MKLMMNISILSSNSPKPIGDNIIIILLNNDINMIRIDRGLYEKDYKDKLGKYIEFNEFLLMNRLIFKIILSLVCLLWFVWGILVFENKIIIGLVLVLFTYFMYRIATYWEIELYKRIKYIIKSVV